MQITFAQFKSLLDQSSEAYVNGQYRDEYDMGDEFVVLRLDEGGLLFEDEFTEENGPFDYDKDTGIVTCPNHKIELYESIPLMGVSFNNEARN